MICVSIQIASADTGSGGIEGQATIGPTCPVVRAGDRQCADRPYRTTITIKSLTGLEVARFATDAQGKFRVSLEPDWYLVTAGSARRMQVVSMKPTPTAPEWPRNQVRVIADEFTDLRLVFDSSIR
jgi:hypothetical protein